MRSTLTITRRFYVQTTIMPDIVSVTEGNYLIRLKSTFSNNHTSKILPWRIHQRTPCIWSSQRYCGSYTVVVWGYPGQDTRRFGREKRLYVDVSVFVRYANNKSQVYPIDARLKRLMNVQINFEIHMHIILRYSRFWSCDEVYFIYEQIVKL